VSLWWSNFQKGQVGSTAWYKGYWTVCQSEMLDPCYDSTAKEDESELYGQKE